MLINNNFQQNFGYYGFNRAAKMGLNNVSKEKNLAIKNAQKLLEGLENAGVEWRGLGVKPCVVSNKGHQFCPPYVPERPISRELTVNAIWDNPNLGPEVGSRFNCVMVFPDNAAALKAYKEINEGSVLDSACAFAKHLDASLKVTV